MSRTFRGGQLFATAERSEEPGDYGEMCKLMRFPSRRDKNNRIIGLAGSLVCRYVAKQPKFGITRIVANTAENSHRKHELMPLLQVGVYG